jgi:CBS domain containing-hemolysin-like protein
MIPAILVFGEIVPKSFFRHRAERKAILIAPFIWGASWVFYPFVYVISKIARGAVYIVAGERGKLSLPYITKDGLKVLLHEEADKTDVKRSEKEMVDRIFDFSETSVGRIMVPLSNVAAIGEEASFGDASKLINETGFSRFPVYQGNVINVVGVVNAFDILKAMPASADRAVREAVRQTLFVPASKPADDLLLEMQRRGEPLAVVGDEYGGAVGIVTIEDILEEIVGDIRDEYDKRERDVRKLGPGRYLVTARIGIERLKEIIPLGIPEGPYETLAGYLLHQMGRIPRRMEQFRAGNIQYVIEDADLKSIKQVQVILPADPSAAKKEEGPSEPPRPATGL